ncbi:hypothetical protein HK102_011178, partial [Quaeritorhiza haematococci]
RVILAIPVQHRFQTAEGLVQLHAKVDLPEPFVYGVLHNRQLRVAAVYAVPKVDGRQAVKKRTGTDTVYRRAPVKIPTPPFGAVVELENANIQVEKGGEGVIKDPDVVQDQFAEVR